MDTDILNHISDCFGLPKDVISDLPLINIIGSHEIVVDNFKNIKEFSDKRIKFNTKDKCIVLSGNSLEIAHLTKESITVKGNFNKLEFG